MEKMQKKLGFGMMRLPMQDGHVDHEQVCQMVDAFMDAGFCYFDTARGYLDGMSEKAVKACVADRYPRERFLLTDKLSENYFQKEEDIRPLFENQLKDCGVAYFDYYLMHAQGAENYGKYKACHAYETAFALKKEGKIRHVGLSFHDTAEMLETILQENPDVEVVQLQFNYADYDDPAIQSRQCYEVCQRYGKPVIVMEPVKGGHLVNLPEEALNVLNGLHGGSPASYAVRFAAGFSDIIMVLSGMSNLEQVTDNISYMKDFQPLNVQEQEAIQQVKTILKKQSAIACTACRYCVAGCPRHISIPDIFATVNIHRLFHDWNAKFYYESVHTGPGRRASDCIGCGKCEKICPQHLPIRQLLKDVAQTFEKKKDE